MKISKSIVTGILFCLSATGYADNIEFLDNGGKRWYQNIDDFTKIDGEEILGGWGQHADPYFRPQCFVRTLPDQIPAKGLISASFDIKTTWYGFIQNTADVFRQPLFYLQLSWLEDDTGIKRRVTRDIRVKDTDESVPLFTENGKVYYTAYTSDFKEFSIDLTSVSGPSSEITAEVCGLWPDTLVTVREIVMTTLPKVTF